MHVNKYLIAIAATISSFSVFAGSALGKINTIYVQPGAVVLDVQNQISRPACATIPGFTIAVDTAQGKATLALLLSAASQSKSITVAGSGVCSLTGNRETILYIGLVN